MLAIFEGDIAPSFEKLHGELERRFGIGRHRRAERFYVGVGRVPRRLFFQQYALCGLAFKPEAVAFGI